jgi:DNA-binding LytR/AlgR family response regulator
MQAMAMATEKINILIVEDESIVALDLATALHQDGYEVIGIADHAEAAIRLFAVHAVDIVLMDIHLAGPKDGIDTVADLMKIRKTPVIYLTAFTDHATVERIKPTYPAAFLAKPYQVSNVRIAIELALHNFAVSAAPARILLDETPLPASTKEPILQMGDCAFVKYNYQFVKVPLADILFVAADSNHINLHTSDKKFVLRLSLSQLFDRLIFDRLIRIHRSYAVNIDAIQSFTEITRKISSSVAISVKRPAPAPRASPPAAPAPSRVLSPTYKIPSFAYISPMASPPPRNLHRL